jgi:iron complex transport system ATP-binding protein
MIQVDNLHFSFAEKKILQGITVQFEAGKIHGIVGPNGSGKSTLLKNICRIWEPQAGKVFINGKDHRSISRKVLSTIVTLVPQNTSIGFPISVYEIVAMGRHPHLGRFQDLSGKDRALIDHALKTTYTYDLRDRNINELSGGESQLAIIARALVTEASLILLDEPTSDLDITHTLTIMTLLEDLKQKNKTILVSIHDLNSAKRYCDTISILHQGRLFFTGLPDEAFSLRNIQEVFDVDMAEVKDDSRSFLYFFKH